MKILYKIIIMFYIIILMHITYINRHLNNNGYYDIIVSEKYNLSDMFLNSVKLYNKRSLWINNLYKRINMYNGYKKAIVVLLNYKEIKKFINRNYIFLKQNYHDILFFYVTENKTVEEEYKNIKYSVIDISDTFFKFPYKFNESQHVSKFIKRGKWNYQHMCRFFFRDIFLHPSLFDVDIYMRLDSESILNTTVNLFQYMNKSIVYMHNKIFNDAAFVVKRLKDFTQSLVKGLKIEIMDKGNYYNTFNKTVLSYYNNFEICRMSFFRSKELLKFSSLVDLSYGQFIYRWGDAPLRYISLSLYAEKYKKISLPKNVNYCHKNCH